jgi:hypothetical protein
MLDRADSIFTVPTLLHSLPCMTSTIRWSLFLALLPAAATAQTTPRVYVGASVALLNRAPFESYSSILAGPAVTAGVQLTSRWAVETGLQVAWQSTSVTYRPIDPTAEVFYDTSVRNTYFLVPVLARLTLTPAASPLRVDLLGGVTWLHSRYTAEQTTYSNSPIFSTRKGSDNSICATLGPQMRYAIGAGFEAKLNLPFNANLDSGYGSFSNRLFLTPQLGLQYTFN